MRHLPSNFRNNLLTVAGIISGLIIGYVYWYDIACYNGQYPLSGECWVNCVFGGITGGFISTLFNELG